VNLCAITFRIEVGSLKSRYKKQEQRNKWQEVTAGAMAAAVAVGNRQSAVGKRNIKH